MTGDVRLHLGCGTVYFPDYINIDAYDTPERGGTVVAPDRILRAEQLDYSDGSVDEIYTAHVFEHLSSAEVQEALLCWHRVLKPGGRLVIEVPDAEAIMRRLLAQRTEEAKDLYYYLLQGTQEFDGEFHKGSYTFARLKRLLESVGFERFVDGHCEPEAFAGTPSYRAFRGRRWRCVLLSCHKPVDARAPEPDRLRRLLFFKYENQDLPFYRFRLRLSRVRGWLRRLAGACPEGREP